MVGSSAPSEPSTFASWRSTSSTTSAVRPSPAARSSSTLPGVSVDTVGQRVRLPDAQKQAVLAAIKAHAALTVPVTAILSWPEPAPASMTAHSVLQPIIVVDALSAL